MTINGAASKKINVSSFKDKAVIIKGYNISKQNLKGMSPEQYITLMEFQNFSYP